MSSSCQAQIVESVSYSLLEGFGFDLLNMQFPMHMADNKGNSLDLEELIGEEYFLQLKVYTAKQMLNAKKIEHFTFADLRECFTRFARRFAPFFRSPFTR